ncbi:MAG: type II toxin-antitoxin system RelE/ParE family toxin [bacterium]|nr:type II toxin-antitoxin system RelE/ParE family toxin [bacterium]
MNWEIELYAKENGEIPVLEFQRSLTAKHRAKSTRDIDMLAEFGTLLREPYVKAVKGERYKGLWELRTKFASDISRIFYFLPVGNRFVLLNGYVKKDMKLDSRELDIAKRYMEDYLRRTQDE